MCLEALLESFVMIRINGVKVCLLGHILLFLRPQVHPRTLEGRCCGSSFVGTWSFALALLLLTHAATLQRNSNSSLSHLTQNMVLQFGSCFQQTKARKTSGYFCSLLFQHPLRQRLTKVCPPVQTGSRTEKYEPACVTSYLILTDLTQQMFIISQFLWVRNLGAT